MELDEMEQLPLCWPKLKQLLINAMSDCEISTFQHETIEPVNTCHYFGRQVGVKVNGTRHDGTEVVFRYIIKSPRRNQHQNDIFAELGRELHWFEVFAYLTLLPTFKGFQMPYPPFDAYPKAMGYFCDGHELAAKEVLLVENVIHQRYIIKNARNPLDINHLETALKTFAEFHAISLAMKQQHPTLFATVVNAFSFRSMFKERVSCICNEQQVLMATRILSLFNSYEYSQHRRLLRKLSGQLLRVMVSTVEMDQDDEDRLTVFGHGNSSLHNILFKYEDKTKPNVPTKVCLIDFQMLRYGSPIFDLSYFIFTATDKATRDEHYDQLIDIYYREVCMRLEQMGSPPAVVFPYDKFQLRLKRFSVLGYFMAQMALYTMLRAPSIKVTDQMTEAEIKESMERNIVESEALYDERIKGMLIDFVEKGYFDFLDEEYPDMEFDESTTDSTDDNMVDEEDL